MGNREVLCHECIPPLLEENEDAIKIYFIVQSQVIVGGMGGTVIDINQLAIHEAMRLYKVENKVKCFEKVRTLNRHFQQERETGGSVDDFKEEYFHGKKKPKERLGK